MKKGERRIGLVEEVRFPNKGIVRLEDETKVQVKNAVPGQKVEVGINKVRKGKGEGSILSVLQKSPLELSEAYCPHFGECGGCTYQTLPYEAQLDLKYNQVKQLLNEVLPEQSEVVWDGITGSPKQFDYRNKMEFSFGDLYKDGPLALGMHKRGSFYDIVPVDQCRIAGVDFTSILKTTLDFFQKENVSFYHKLRHVGYLRHLLLRRGEKTGEIMVDLVTTTELDPDRERELLLEYTDLLKKLSLEGTLTGVLHTKNDAVADTITDQGTEILFGQDFFYEELLGLRFRITPFSFFQTNSLGAEVLYQKAREYVGNLIAEGQEPDKIVYDLYSGTGTIAQILAPVAKKVIGVEIVPQAVQAACENASMNGLENCEFLAGDVLKVLDTIIEKPDFIVLDPPRDGIHPKALERIISYGVERLVYISCKPTSLARDLEVLQARGYQVDRIGCVDMFPGTVHVECVVALHRVDM